MNVFPRQRREEGPSREREQGELGHGGSEDMLKCPRQGRGRERKPGSVIP